MFTAGAFYDVTQDAFNMAVTGNLHTGRSVGLLHVKGSMEVCFL